MFDRQIHEMLQASQVATKRADRKNFAALVMSIAAIVISVIAMAVTALRPVAGI